MEAGTQDINVTFKEGNLNHDNQSLSHSSSKDGKQRLNNSDIAVESSDYEPDELSSSPPDPDSVVREDGNIHGVGFQGEVKSDRSAINQSKCKESQQDSSPSCLQSNGVSRPETPLDMVSNCSAERNYVYSSSNVSLPSKLSATKNTMMGDILIEKNAPEIILLAQKEDIRNTTEVIENKLDVEIDDANKSHNTNLLMPGKISDIKKQNITTEGVSTVLGEPEQIKTVNLSGKSLLKVKKSGSVRKPNASNTDGSTETDDREVGKEFHDTFSIRQQKRKNSSVDTESEPMSELWCSMLSDANAHKRDLVVESHHESKDERAPKRRKRSKPSEDPNFFDIKQKGSYVCWVCYKKFAHCMGVKRHILQKHSKAFCALRENISSLPQLLLFCPQNCNYVTLNLDAFCLHITTCQEPQLEDGQKILEIQDTFISQEYAELMGKVASETLFDEIKSRKAKASRKKKKQENNLIATKSSLEKTHSKSTSTDGQNFSCNKTEQAKVEDRQAMQTEQNGSHLCDVCNEVFTSSLSLQQHIESKHDDNNRDGMLEIKEQSNIEQPVGGEFNNEAAGSDSFICNYCGKIFSSSKYLISHLRIHKELTEKRAFKCEKCGKTFNRSTNLVIHMRIHTGEKPFKCNECGRCFSTNSNILIHMRIHTGEKPFKCSECDKSFCRKNDLKTHMRIHTGEKPFKCQDCGQSFRTNSNILNHMRIHTGEKPYICRECGNSFSRSGDLMVHKRIHTGERPFKCNECDQSYKTNWNLLLHMKTHSIKKPHKPHKCDECGKSFYRSEELQTHMRIHTEEKAFQCSKCNREFFRSSDLQRHMKIHTGEGMYKCDFCEKVFNRNVDLHNHMRGHTGERPYKCNICGKSFSRIGAFSIHMRVHTGEKPPECDQCGKIFTRKDQLQCHMRTHTGEKPFICSWCNKGFSQSGQLNKHMMKKHAKENPSGGSNCGETFSQESQIREHTKTHNEEKPLDSSQDVCSSIESAPKSSTYSMMKQYQCSVCSKIFNKCFHLKRHMKIHTGDKPYQCEECKRCFNQKSILNRHLRTHTGERPFECSECGKTFSQSAKLKTHMRTHII